MAGRNCDSGHGGHGVSRDRMAPGAKEAPMRFLTACLITLTIAAPAIAEDRLNSPYRDQLLTEIRGLTEKEISDLREARGMGLARAAELNGYPGPRHLLDAEREGQLHLTSDQLRTVTELFDAMARDARRVGERLLGQERDLEQELRTGTIAEPGSPCPSTPDRGAPKRAALDPPRNPPGDEDDADSALQRAARIRGRPVGRTGASTRRVRPCRTSARGWPRLPWREVRGHPSRGHILWSTERCSCATLPTYPGQLVYLGLVQIRINVSPPGTRTLPCGGRQ